MIVAETVADRPGEMRMVRLQWGRDLIVAETTTTAAIWGAAATLQWGRDLIVAETRQAVAPPATRQTSFNGAAT